jgi:hypothetical protein
MDRIILKWLVDLGLGISFFVCFITGLLKYTVLLQVTGLSEVVLPSAFISDLHDQSGIILGFFVFLHLFLNHRWIIATTRKILSKTPPDP